MTLIIISSVVICIAVSMMMLYFWMLISASANDKMRSRVKHIHKMILVVSTGLIFLLVAGFIENLWYSVVGVLISITGISSYFNQLRSWFAETEYVEMKSSFLSIIIWLLWLGLLGLLITHFIYIWIY
ncbi:MAG: hypothetical protein Q8P90_02155 [bacterium]|nr:hypothetical protein [bacterium]